MPASTLCTLLCLSVFSPGDAAAYHGEDSCPYVDTAEAMHGSALLQMDRRPAIALSTVKTCIQPKIREAYIKDIKTRASLLEIGCDEDRGHLDLAGLVQTGRDHSKQDPSTTTTVTTTPTTTAETTTVTTTPTTTEETTVTTTSTTTAETTTVTTTPTTTAETTTVTTTPTTTAETTTATTKLTTAGETTVTTTPTTTAETTTITTTATTTAEATTPAATTPEETDAIPTGVPTCDSLAFLTDAKANLGLWCFEIEVGVPGGCTSYYAKHPGTGEIFWCMDRPEGGDTCTSRDMDAVTCPEDEPPLTLAPVETSPVPVEEPVSPPTEIQPVSGNGNGDPNDPYTGADPFTASLDAAGFVAITSRCCPWRVETWFNRLLNSLGYRECSKRHIQGLMHWFTCVPNMDFKYVLETIESGTYLGCKYWAKYEDDCPAIEGTPCDNPCRP